MTVIITGLKEVERALSGASSILSANIGKAVAVNARKVQKSARAKASGHPRWAGYPRTITYDVHQSEAGASADIGPDKELKGQAPYGTILEYGTPRTAPIPHLGPALDENADDLEKGVETAVTQALGLL